MEPFNLELDYYGLLNLHKALLEAKFHIDPDNELISGSPIIAQIYIQVRELLINSDRPEEWKERFQLKNRPYYRERAMIRMRKDRRWCKACPDKKAQIAETYLAPFLYDEAELNAVIAELDKNYQHEG